MYKERFIFHKEVKEIKEQSIDEEHFLDNLLAYFNKCINEEFENSEKMDKMYNEGYDEGYIEAIEDCIDELELLKKK